MRFIDLEIQYQRYKKEIDAAMSRVVTSCQFINGPEVAQLESTLAEYVGTDHGVGFSSGTDSLQAILMALGVGPGDEVITTPFTFIASAEVIATLGAKPVFVDVRPDTLNMDPALLEAAIGPKTKAILPVSLFGQCAPMEAIQKLADAHGLFCLEDGCQSFGAKREGRRSCGLSNAGATSFFPAKPLGCYGDGGMAFTNDAALAGELRVLREHGQHARYQHARIGMNGRLDTLQAAVLLAKFPFFEEEIALRQQVAGYYLKHLPKGILGPIVLKENQSVFSQFTIRVPHRDRIQAHLTRAGIPTAIHYPIPLHRQPVFAADFPDPKAFPIATQAAQEVLSLPMHPFLATGQQDRVLVALQEAIKEIS